MARISKNIAFTAPPTIVEEFEQIAREEHSTKSELFRRMFRFYQASRKSPKRQASDIDGNFDAWAMRVIFEAAEEKKTGPVDEAGLLEIDDGLLRYGAERAQAAGITSEDEIDAVVYEERQKHR